MKIDLAVIGQGAVSPAGIGVDALLRQEPVATQIASLGCPDKLWPVLRIDLKSPALVQWQKEPRLRRASPITLFLVEAAHQALASLAATDRAETGLIVTFSAGCLAYSRRFFEGIVTNGQRTASPALFPETVFNSPVSHVATVLGLNGAAYALVGDETGWIAALKTASVWLRQGRVKQVLVLGVEEFDPIVLDAYQSAGWLRRQQATPGFLTSEGAAALLVKKAEDADSLVLSNLKDGLIYRSRKEASIAADQLVMGMDSGIPFYPTAQHNWAGSLEKKVAKARQVLSRDKLPYLGEAFTASAAWNTIRALHHLTSDTPYLSLPIWGLNHQFGSLQLEKRK